MELVGLKHSVIEVKKISREDQQKMSIEERISKVEGKLKNSKKKNEGNQHNLREMQGNIKAQEHTHDQSTKRRRRRTRKFQKIAENFTI